MKFSASQELADRVLDTPKFKNVVNIGIGTYIGEADIAWVDDSPCNILIGRYCSLAGGITFTVARNHMRYNAITTYPFSALEVLGAFMRRGKKYVINDAMRDFHKWKWVNRYQVIIGNDVWIGNNATVMSGVRIGSGAIVGGNAVVAKDVPPYAVVAGNPARVIKYRFPPDAIKKFMAIKWWNWDLDKVTENIPMMYRVDEFLSEHYSPELSNITKNVTGGGDIQNMLYSRLKFGSKFYQFVADFRSAQPLWKRIVNGFCRSNSQNDLLLIWLGRNTTDADVQAVNDFVASITNDSLSKNILVIRSQGAVDFMPSILRQATHFITTREMVTLECLDWLYDTDVKILSALDNGIFDDEPVVDWQEMF